MSDTPAFNPQRLKQLRLAHGWSLDALQAALGDGVVSKQSLSKYENGRAVPGMRVLRPLAAIFGLRATDFIDETRVEVVAYRKRAALPKKVAAQLIAQSSEHFLAAVRVRQLLQPAAKLPFARPQSTPVDAAGAERAAETLRRAWGLAHEPIGSLVETMESRGIHVLFVDAPPRFDGLALVARRADDAAEIAYAAVIRRTGPGERQRFSLAHELGHLYLAQAGERRRDETNAHRFAGALLAPRSLLISDIGERRHVVGAEELFSLKAKYGMSIQALLHRLADLDIISQAYYGQWCIEINRRGWRVEEPRPVPPDQSDWLRRSVLRLVSEQVIAIDEAERILGERLPHGPAQGLAAKRRLMALPSEQRHRLLAQEAERAASSYEVDQDWQEVDLAGA